MIPAQAIAPPKVELLPGISRAVQDVNRLIREFAPTPGITFLTGEPGTEKSLVAKLLHVNSPRADRPLGKVAVSWKLPPELIQHVDRCRKGTLVVMLQREFPIDMQYTLVEMASHGVFGDPMGDETVECGDMGIVLLTSQTMEGLTGGRTGTILPELRELMEARRIEVPPLRERPEDIPALVRYAIQRARETGRTQVTGADAQVLALFRHWHWPRNSEDLLLVSAQAAISAKGEQIGLLDLPEEFLNQVPQDLLEGARQVRAPKGPGIIARRRDPATPLGIRAPQPIADSDPHPAEVTAPTPVVHTRTIPLEEALAAASAPIESASSADPAGDQIPRRLMVLARRLRAQSGLLNTQMSSPGLALLRPEPQAPPDAETVALRTLEDELERGVDLVLALRRQVARLKQRQRDSLGTIKDLIQRIRVGDSLAELGDDHQRLTEQLRAIVEIIARVSAMMPDVGASLESALTDEDTKS